MRLSTTMLVLGLLAVIAVQAVAAEEYSFVSQWGGPATGTFESPTGVAVDTSGNVYVADTVNQRVQKFSSSGTFIRAWGYLGDGDGELNTPLGIAVGPDNNIYVVDGGNSRVQVFSANGEFVRKWGHAGSATGLFSSPSGIAVGGDGKVYVADKGNNRVQQFAPDGTYQSSITTHEPIYVAVDAAGNVYAIDGYANGDQVSKFSPSGTLITSWAPYGWDPDQLADPQGICTDGTTFVYIVDVGHGDRVVKYTLDGVYQSTWGVWGHNDGQFDSPRGIAYSSANEIFVTDAGNNRVQVFSPIGDFVRKWGRLSGTEEGCLRGPIGLVADSSGKVYVADKENRRIQKFANDGAFLLQWEAFDVWAMVPTDVAVDANDTVYVCADSDVLRYSNTGVLQKQWHFGLGYSGLSVDRARSWLYYIADGRTVYKTSLDGALLTSWGSYGANNGQFMAAEDTATDADGNVYVVDSYNNRVQKFTPDGEFITAWGSKGEGPTQFSSPEGICVDLNGNILVADTGNHRICKYTPSGSWLDSWGTWGGGPGEFATPAGIAVDRGGNLFVSDRESNRVQKFRSTVAPPVLPVPPSTLTPTDTDSDGLYDDVNGNGRADFADIVLFFHQMAWIELNEPLSAFDYNGNGRIDFADVVWLFSHL